MDEEIKEIVSKITQEFLDVLKKYYPEIVDKKFDSFGFPDREGCPAFERAFFCIYIELVKAGAFKTGVTNNADI